MERANGVSREIYFYAEQQINDQQSDCNPLAHVTGERQAAKHEDASATVRDATDIKSVARALLITHARQRAIQAIAKPIQSEKYDRQNQACVGIARIPIGKP